MYGILGINARNQKYLDSSKKIKRTLDSKLLTKKILKENGLPVPDTLALIKTRSELFNFNWEILPNTFALKPNRGFGGQGIIVVYGKKKKAIEPTWIRSDGSLVRKEDLEMQILDIMEGNFSLFSLPDVAFFEERIKVLKELKPYSWKGIPDIRVIVFEGVPVMAMLRLPTLESKGRANLHQGAVGVGIDLGTGLTTTAVWHNKFIDYYPGTRYLLRGIKIPYFKEILKLSINAQFAMGIKFLGVDIAIDRERGPVILELNVRPGLSIQMANLAGLEERLKRISGLNVKSSEKGVRLAQDLFGESKEDQLIEAIDDKKLEPLLGRKILGLMEEVEIIIPHSDKEKTIDNNLAEQSYKTIAKIDTGAWRTAISFEIAQKLKIKEGEELRMVVSALGKEIRTITPLTFILKGERIDTEVFLADRSQMKYEMIIGRRDLKRFIIDPAKKINIKTRQ